MTRVLYPSLYDSLDVGAWSGLVYFIAKALTEQSMDLVRTPPLSLRWAPLLKLRREAYRLSRQRHLTMWEPAVLDGYASQIRGLLDIGDVDAIFSTSTIPIARLKCAQPIVFWVDATIPAMMDYYRTYSHFSRATIRNAIDGERRALAQCAAAIYSSDWAARSAIEDLGADRERVHVIPFGANIDRHPSASEVDSWIKARRLDKCRLLFLGVDWYRKGGPLAVDVAALLNSRGLETELVVAGCDPPSHLPAFVRRYGFVDKSTESGRRKLATLLAEANFLILPSRAEAYGVVLAEACAYGVPCLTTDTGGIPTVVRNGVNGYVFDTSSPPEVYAAAVWDVHSTSGAYELLARSAFNESRFRLNWRVSGRKAADVIEAVVSGRRQPVPARPDRQTGL